MFEEKSLKYVQRKIQNILEVHCPHLFLKPRKTANLLQVLSWQNPYSVSQLAFSRLCWFNPEPPASWAPSFLSPQLPESPASCFCLLCSVLWPQNRSEQLYPGRNEKAFSKHKSEPLSYRNHLPPPVSCVHNPSRLWPAASFRAVLCLTDTHRRRVVFRCLSGFRVFYPFHLLFFFPLFVMSFNVYWVLALFACSTDFFLSILLIFLYHMYLKFRRLRSQLGSSVFFIKP